MTNQEAINVLLNEQKCINRNDGIQCDRKCGSCDLAMDAEQIRGAYSMAISALQAQDANDINADTISRQAAIDAVENITSSMSVCVNTDECYGMKRMQRRAVIELTNLPSAQPEQRYTEEELRVFRHGISLSLLSKRSSQHWYYDDDTATEIEFLERLYEKVCADMRGDEDE